ncbi:MAG: hypothetical protein RJB26_52, partial [Pseudomonadota bacterium]
DSFNAVPFPPSVGNFRKQVLDFAMLPKSNRKDLGGIRARTVIFP